MTPATPSPIVKFANGSPHDKKNANKSNAIESEEIKHRGMRFHTKRPNEKANQKNGKGKISGSYRITQLTEKGKKGY